MYYFDLMVVVLATVVLFAPVLGFAARHDVRGTPESPEFPGRFKAGSRRGVVGAIGVDAICPEEGLIFRVRCSYSVRGFATFYISIASPDGLRESSSSPQGRASG